MSTYRFSARFAAVAISLSLQGCGTSSGVIQSLPVEDKQLPAPDLAPPGDVPPGQGNAPDTNETNNSASPNPSAVTPEPSTAPDGRANEASATAQPVAQLTTDIVYRTDLDSKYNNLVSLDVHYHEESKVKPVFIFIHGGGWISGDKAEAVNPEVSQLGEFIKASGYMLVSVNYRLVDVEAFRNNLPSANYVDQASDVAHAIAWVKKNISSYGGNPEQLVLAGHSAGAHLAPLVVLDQSYLKGVGLMPDVIKKVISFDVHAYSIPLAISLMQGNATFSSNIQSLKLMFGQTDADQLKASPSNFIAAVKALPSFLILSAGKMRGTVNTITKDTSAVFVECLKEAGFQASHSHFENEDHSSIVADLNTAGDPPAAVVSSFLASQSQTQQASPSPSPTPTPSSSSALRVAPLSEIAAQANLLAPGHVAQQGNTTRPSALVIGIVTPQGKQVLGFGKTTIGGSTSPNGDTLFAIGSVTKVLTGVILAQAVTKNAVTLNTSANQLLAQDLRLPGNAITLQHLITHMSGLGNYPSNISAFRDLDNDGQNDYITRMPGRNYSRELLAQWSASSPQLMSQPGTRSAYSNLGIGVLGMLLQEKMGYANYDALAQAKILSPLGMTLTGGNIASLQQKAGSNQAQGYAAETNAAPVAFGFSEMGVLGASGELLSTANNMLAFLEGMAGVTQTSLSDAFQESHRSLAVNGSDGLAYGFSIKPSSKGGVYYFKSGETAGFSATIIWRKDPKIGIVVLSNLGKYQGVNTLGQKLIEDNVR